MSNEAVKTLTAFLRAEYGDGHAEPRWLHIGETDTLADTRHWITAWNPFGVEREDSANHADQTALQDDLAAAGLASEPGWARSPASSTETSWCEPCAVVRGATDAFIDTLARRYRQLAIVVAPPGAPARLRCYSAFWIERFGIADMDARNVEWVA
jgi:hypothetical protein